MDATARRLVTEMPGGGALLLTSRDLSTAGWRVDSEAPGEATFVAQGARHHAREIAGVVCLLPCIFEQELVEFPHGERPYVAAEMTAFLVWWLSTLDCPRLNTPTAGCLSGPSWRPERWLLAAEAAGAPIEPLVRATRVARTEPVARAEFARVILVGQRCLGEVDPQLGRWARALADQADVDVLGVSFARRAEGFVFRAADPFPELDDPEAPGAIREYFESGSAR